MARLSMIIRLFSKLLILVSGLFYRSIYLCVLFFIFIGDIVQQIIKFPFVILIRLLRLTIFAGVLVAMKLENLIPFLKKYWYSRPSISLFPSRLELKEFIDRRQFGRQHPPQLVDFKRKRKIEIGQLLIKIIFLPLVSATSKIRYFIIGAIFALAIISFQQTYNFINSLPNPKLIGSVNYSLSTHIYDRNGKLLYEIYRDQNRTPVKLKDLPSYVAQSTIAIEDKDFYKHKGVSFFSGVLRAVKESVLHKNLQGGSTITQQLVKTALLTPERTFQRKIKEIVLALWTEQLFTKQQILEMYLNQVPYGGSSYGIEEASKTYFAKHAKDLTIDEAALLAGLPQAPSLYSPYSNPDAALKRRNEVIKKMREQGYVSKEDKTLVHEKDISVVSVKTSIKAPHFVFYVKQQLEDKYGIKQVEEGGMRVTTTLDLEVQQETEKILKEELDKIKNLNVTNGAILVTRPSTGEILAMAGSVDYFEFPYGAFNVTTALRQPGSSIKPIMYSLALDKGYTAATVIDDSPVSYPTAGGTYIPVNYDGRFHGRIPLRLALANSYNIPAVRTLNSIGVNNFANYAKNLGISTWNDPSRFGLSLTLGGGEVTMIDMATAYGVFANSGYRVDSNSIINIDDSFRSNIFTIAPEKIRVTDSGNAYIISDILSDSFARQWAFGQKSLLDIPGYRVSVKTGTTDNKKDNWTIGYTPNFLVVVWVGNNNGDPMNPYLASGITGAAPIWNRTMSYLLKTYGTTTWYQKPENVVSKNCYFGRKEYFLKGTENSIACGRQVLESSNPSTQPTPIN